MHHPVPAAHRSPGVTAVFTMHNPDSDSLQFVMKS